MENNVKEYIHHFENLSGFTTEYNGFVEKIAIGRNTFIWFSYSGVTTINGQTAHAWVIDEEFVEISGLASGSLIYTIERNPEVLDYFYSVTPTPLRYPIITAIKASDEYYEPWVSLCEESPSVTITGLNDALDGTYSYVESVYEEAGGDAPVSPR